MVLSVASARTCEFISISSKEDGGDPPFDTAIVANVGIFSYEILESSSTTDGCVDYEETFGDLSDTYPSLTAAQYSAYFAPIIGGVALVVIVFDTLVCTFRGGFYMIGTPLFALAAGIQAGTFSILAGGEYV
jgi:hypothetical protein